MPYLVEAGAPVFKDSRQTLKMGRVVKAQTFKASDYYRDCLYGELEYVPQEGGAPEKGMAWVRFADAEKTTIVPPAPVLEPVKKMRVGGRVGPYQVDLELDLA